MNVSMPTGNTHGWGIAGQHLSSEIKKLAMIPGVTLHCVAGHDFAPSDETQWNQVNIGYCFFEHEILAYRFIPAAARRWDHIVAGSSWCEHHLRISGMERTSTILQGIDPGLFHAVPPRSDDGRFIVFSGGKFEYRKGHDLVIAAMRIFMARHRDVWLACAWHNQWPNSIKTMNQTRLIDFRYDELPCEQLYLELLARNGIDTSRVTLLPVTDNSQMRPLYANSHVGLFPNRCEGGNNMVMCEYMACGRPVIASTRTGHSDVISDDYALCLTKYQPILATLEGHVTGVWFEADVDEIVELLEQAYLDRDRLNHTGIHAASAMKRLSWSGAAKDFHTLGMSLAPAAVSLDYPSPADFRTLFDAGRYAQAEQVARNLLAGSPLVPDLHSDLATVLDRLERYPEAVLCYEKALLLRPDFWEARFNLGNTLKRMGKGDEAVKELEIAVSSQPDYVPGWQNLALCYFDIGDITHAAECLEKVLVLDPDCRKSRVDLGDILIELGRYHEAVRYFDEALLDDPDDKGVLNSKGTALQALDDLDGAEECYRKILSLDPDNDLAWNNLGTVLRSRGYPFQAIVCFNRALEKEPEDSQLIFNRSLARLAIGDFARGWKDYESRFTSREPVKLYHQNLPRWNGEHLGDRILLVHSEQGYGDTLQFIRYIPLLKRFGGKIIVEVQDNSIKSAVSGIDTDATIIARGEAIPTPDYQIPLLSLPGIFETDLSSIPAPGGYLKPHPELRIKWEKYFGPPDGRLKIGLVWGGRKPRLNANRSMQLKDLATLFDIEGIRWISLQLGPDASQLHELPNTIEDVSTHIGNFGDTAALITCLDLVISIDSAVAHLAGALGSPAWIMLKLAPDWRWFLDRSDSPWYSSLKLFRQIEFGNWQTVVADMSQQLKIILDKKSAKVKTTLPDT